MLLADLRQAVLETAQRMANEGLVRSTNGNISARDAATGLIAVTPSAMEYHRLTPADIVVMDLDGRVVDGQRKPSIEHPMHRKILRERPDVGAIVHTHSIYATAFACMKHDLPVLSTELAGAAGALVRVAGYAESATEELGEAVLRALGGGTAALLQSHGAVALGRDLQQAFGVAWAIESAAQIYLIARQLGDPVPLPEQHAAKLHRFYLEEYGQR